MGAAAVSLAAHAVAGAVPDHHLAVHHPFGGKVAVAALGQVDFLALAVSRDNTNFAIGEARLRVLKQQPLAVRAPSKVLVIVAHGEQLVCVQQGAYLLAGQIDAPSG